MPPVSHAGRVNQRLAGPFSAEAENFGVNPAFIQITILKTAWPAFNSSLSKPGLLQIFSFIKQQIKNRLRVGCAAAYAVFSLLFWSFVLPAGPLVLQPKPLGFSPAAFYVAEVLDNRTDPSAVAWVYPPVSPKQKPVLQILDLQGGGTAAMQAYLLKSLPRNKSLHPVVVCIKECKITETLTAVGRVEGQVALSLVFELQNETGNIRLTDYRLDTHYIRPENAQNIWVPALQESFNSGLKYFNTWINQQADHHPKLARRVTVTVSNHQELSAGDTIYYSPARPLVWADFQDKPQGGKYAAMVFPSFGFEEKQDVKNGEIRLRIDLKIYMPKSACWVKPGSQNSYTLNHEQRHFDLVAIVGRHFEQKIKAARLPVLNPDGLINVEYYESFREMNRLQKQYDDETGHGLNTYKQEEWNSYIDKQLLDLGIAKPAL